MEGISETEDEFYGNFFSNIENDPRIRMGHLAVFAALFYLWGQKSEKGPISVYAGEVMQIAKISSKGTYLRIVGDLSEYGYLDYRPSNTKVRPSKIRLIGKCE